MKAADFARVLKAYRMREGVTQAQASAQLGVPLRTWQNWEIARNLPPSFALAALLDLLDQNSPPPPPSSAKPMRPRPARRKEKKETVPAPVARTSGETSPASPLATHLL